MLYTFFMEQVWVKFERNAFSFQNRTICDLHVFTTSGNNLSLIRQALHRCSSIYFTSSLWNRAQFVALKESVKFEIHWNTMKYIWNIFSNLLSFCEWNSWMELLTRLLQLQERDFGNWHYLCSALVNEIFARLLFHFSICFYKISQDYMIQMIRFHKSDSSFFGALQISTRQEMLFRDLRPCVSAKQWNVEDGFIWFISLQARSKVILAFEDEQRCVNMYLWSPLDPTKLIFFVGQVNFGARDTAHSLAHVGSCWYVGVAMVSSRFRAARPDASSYASLLHSLRGSNAAADPIGMQQTAFSATMQRCLK